LTENEPKPTAEGVTLLVPVYNEENGVEGVVRRLAGLDLGVPIELLLVDDGSSDGTADKLATLESEFPVLRVLRHRFNRGYGAALKTGFAAAKHEIVVFTDADGTYPEDRISDLLACIDDGASMAVGARIGADVNIPLIRKPAKRFLRWLAEFLVGQPIPDLNSGLRAIRRGLVMRFRPVLPDGFSFTTTITLASMKNDERVDYVSIDYAKRSGKSKIKPIRDTLGFASLIIRTVMYFNPLKVFFPVAFVVGLVFVVFLGLDVYNRNLGERTILMFVAFVQILAVGLLADLIDKRSRM